MRPDADTVAAVTATLPAVRRWAEQVVALGLPLTLDHNDLHENNVFHVGDDLRFFDFGDALLTEPLGVLLIPLDILGGRLDLGPGRPAPLVRWSIRCWRCGATSPRSPTSAQLSRPPSSSGASDAWRPGCAAAPR